MAIAMHIYMTTFCRAHIDSYAVLRRKDMDQALEFRANHFSTRDRFQIRLNHGNQPVDDVKEATAALGAKVASKTAVAGAASAIEDAANKALDAVETLLFGQLGGADAVLRDDRSALDRLRADAGLDPRPRVAPPAPHDPIEDARRQLDEMKRELADKRSSVPSPEPRKKTL